MSIDKYAILLEEIWKLSVEGSSTLKSRDPLTYGMNNSKLKKAKLKYNIL